MRLGGALIWESCINVKSGTLFLFLSLFCVCVGVCAGDQKDQGKPKTERNIGRDGVLSVRPGGYGVERRSTAVEYWVAVNIENYTAL